MQSGAASLRAASASAPFTASTTVKPARSQTRRAKCRTWSSSSARKMREWAAAGVAGVVERVAALAGAGSMGR